MSRSHKVLGFLFVILFGVYGCSRSSSALPGGTSTTALEAKIQRLEEDFRTASAARDSFRQKLQSAEEKQGALQRQHDQLVTLAAQDRQDRDAARTELKTRTLERDTLQTQYESFRKNIRELLGQAETALNNPASAPTVLAATPVPTTVPAATGVPTIPMIPAAPASPLPEIPTLLPN